MIGKTMPNIKYDSEKQFKFYHYVKIISSDSLFIYVLTQQTKDEL
jgi:hypothetical protein